MSASGVIFGVDFGTSKLCAAALDGHGVPRPLPDALGRTVLPALLSFHPDGRILVGDEALPRRLDDPKQTVYGVARLLGLGAGSREVLDAASRVPFTVRVGADDQPVVTTRAGDMTLAEVAALLLEHVRRFAEVALDDDSRRCVLTCPAAYAPAQRQALVAAGRAAGFEVERVLDDPLAAATAWATGRKAPPLLAVYDFGGGKLEVSVVQMAREPRLLGTAADSMLSGDEIDNRIVDYTVKAFWQVHRHDLRADPLVPLRLRDAAERAKIALAERDETSIDLPRLAQVPALGRSIDLHLQLSREVVAAAVRDIIQRSLGVADEALRQAGVARESIGEILLAGSVTRLPFVREAVGQHFGRNPRIDGDAEHGVALGAAVWGVYGGIPDAQNPGSVAKRVTANFGSESQQAVPSEAVPGEPEKRRVGRVHTKRMFTAVMQAVGGADAAAAGEAGTGAAAGAAVRRTPLPFDPNAADFSSARPVKPQVLEVLASRLACSTVGGFCDEIIAKEIPVPVEKTRVFSTGKDNQRMVRIDVCQGDSRRFAENMRLGSILLDGLPPRPRGAVRIAVSFSVDSEGVLRASATDEATGRAQTVEIRLKE